MTRVLVADDHPIVLSGIKAILADSEFNVVAAVRDGRAALEMLPETRPDIVVLDLAMPHRSGLDVARTLRGRGDRRPIVILTADIADADLYEAIRIGVNGIVLKDEAQELLLKCLAAVSRGSRWIEKDLLERALDVAVSESAARPDPFSELTARERAVVGLVARGLRNREIADELNLSEGTVKVYLHRIYDKLGVGNRTELALQVRDLRGQAD